MIGLSMIDKMPNNCHECELSAITGSDIIAYYDDWHVNRRMICSILFENVEDCKDERYCDCPLVEIKEGESDNSGGGSLE